MIGSPALIVMDEPVSGLDPRQVIEMREMIASIKGTVLLSSHILSEVYKTCDQFILLREGKIVARFSHHELDEEMKKNAKMEIKISGEVSGVEKLLNELSEAESVTFIKESSDGSVFHIKAKNNDSLRRELLPLVSARGFELLEIRSLELTLEEIFIDRI